MYTSNGVFPAAPISSKLILSLGCNEGRLDTLFFTMHVLRTAWLPYTIHRHELGGRIPAWSLSELVASSSQGITRGLLLCKCGTS